MSDDLKDFNPEETVIRLKFPIERKGIDGVTSLIYEIKLKRFKFKHIKLLPAGLMDAVTKKGKPTIGAKEAGALIPLISSLSGLTEEETGDIDFVDLVEVVSKLGDVLGK